jgi:V/A-type H+-transporting ATPase subunit I
VSIVALKKVLFCGHVDSKTQTLNDLQALGCLHLIPLTEEGEPAGEGSGPSRQSRDALQFLASCPGRRRQVSNPTRFDAVEVERGALALQKKLFDLREQRDYLASRLKNLEPWGDFQFTPLEEVGGQRLWFYTIPRRELDGLAQIEHPWHIVNSDERFAYLIVLSEDEPAEVPFERTLTGELGRIVGQSRGGQQQ